MNYVTIDNETKITTLSTYRCNQITFQVISSFYCCAADASSAIQAHCVHAASVAVGRASTRAPIKDVLYFTRSPDVVLTSIRASRAESAYHFRLSMLCRYA